MPIEMEVQAGDYIAARVRVTGDDMGIAGDILIGQGRYRTLSEDVTFPFTNKTFDLLADQIMSLNGEMAPSRTPRSQVIVIP